MSEAVIEHNGTTDLVRRDSMAIYMDQAKRFPLLSREEEHALAVRVTQHGDEAAARQLAESNLRLVVKIAYEYQRAHLNVLDLVQEGNIGLLHAVTRFDPHRDVRFTTYAAWWIRACILKFVLNNHRLVKLGTTQAQRKLFFNLHKERDRLEARGFSADSAALAQALGVREKDVVEMDKRLGAPDSSMDQPVVANDEQRSRTLHDVIEGAPGERPDETVEQSQFRSVLQRKLASFADALDGREERIFRGRWLTEQPVTLRELGAEFGVSRERARQIEKRLLGRVRQYLVEELGTAVEVGLHHPMAA